MNYLEGCLEMSKKQVNDYVEDFVACGTKNCCDTCKAHQRFSIDGKDIETLCVLLCEYREHLKNAIDETIERN